MSNIKQAALELALTAVNYATNSCIVSGADAIRELEQAIESGHQSCISDNTISEAILCLRIYQNHGHSMTERTVNHIKSVTANKS